MPIECFSIKISNAIILYFPNEVMIIIITYGVITFHQYIIIVLCVFLNIELILRSQ